MGSTSFIRLGCIQILARDIHAVTATGFSPRGLSSLRHICTVFPKAYPHFSFATSRSRRHRSYSHTPLYIPFDGPSGTFPCADDSCFAYYADTFPLFIFRIFSSVSAPPPPPPSPPRPLPLAVHLARLYLHRGHVSPICSAVLNFFLSLYTISWPQRGCICPFISRYLNSSESRTKLELLFAVCWMEKSLGELRGRRKNSSLARGQWTKKFYRYSLGAVHRVGRGDVTMGF